MRSETLQNVTMPVQLSYGIQKKQIDIHLLGYILEYSAYKSREKLDLQLEDKSCILWTHTEAQVTQLAIKANCGGFSYKIQLGAGLKTLLKGLYFGIERQQVKDLRGGQWRLQAGGMLSRLTFKVAAVEATDAENVPALRQLENKLKSDQSGFNLQMPQDLLVINIPFTTTFALENDARQLNLQLIPDQSWGEGAYASEAKAQQILHYRTNQSIEGVKVSIDCDTPVVRYNSTSACEMKNTQTNDISPLLFLLAWCENDRYCIKTKDAYTRLVPSVPHTIYDKSGQLYFTLQAVAPELGLKKAAGEYTAKATIKVESIF